LNNGTPFMTVHLAEAVYHCMRIISLANLTAALSIDALCGTRRAFRPEIHQARNHREQIEVAKEINAYFDGSERQEKIGYKRVQDAYSFRCTPQVHGPVLRAIRDAEEVETNEMNAVTDNPVVVEEEVLSGGNFHGQCLAQTADNLAIAMTTLGNISERRTERLVNSQLSGLPSFLVDANASVGVNSGFMIVQYASAALCAENRTFAAPGSVHSIPTCENAEDHVSMGAGCVRKLIMIVDNTYKILANELFCAVQAMEFRPEKTSPRLQEVMDTVRSLVPRVTEDRYMKPDIDQLIHLLREGHLVH